MEFYLTGHLAEEGSTEYLALTRLEKKCLKALSLVAGRGEITKGLNFTIGHTTITGITYLYL